jgi:molecular chaperone GrpE
MTEKRRPAGAPAEPPKPAGAPDGGTPAPAAEASEDAAAKEVREDIDRMLEDTKRERDEYLELAQRTRADFENYRKRVAAEARAASARGKAELAGQLIEVIDNLERALAATEIDAAAALDGELSVEGPLEQGIVLTYRELSQALGRAGVEAYDPRGERFDPTWHEALQTRAEEEVEAGTVVEVLQRGYRLDGQVLRPARVVVSE